MLPIIKKWLYSDMDIFMRELISNAHDAISKLKRLDNLGETNLPEDEQFKITVTLNREAKTIEITDNGLGMTDDEIDKYINQIAFSGAEEFIKKYESKNDEGQIIGHFGLGFYSAFMVAHKVEIDSLSYKTDAKACHWICDGGTEFEISQSDKSDRGTKITLHISEEHSEFLEDYKLRTIIKKYCDFLPVEIYFENTASKSEESTPINNTNPLWLKKANDCTQEEYEKFYTSVFMDFNKPLFWIHLNMDYPFRLKGILYFPKIAQEVSNMYGQIKLFCNQVFVADNVKEVIPEFLLQLKGVIDCPDLPLNVSRSFLQADEQVQKMSAYIIRKVADKLVSLAKDSREEYNNYWDSINQFIKYGCIVDPSFYEKCKDGILYKSIDNNHYTLDEYITKNEPILGSKQVVYASDSKVQSQHIKMYAEQNIDIISLETRIDIPFISSVEAAEEGISFLRIDSGLIDAIKQDDNIEIDENAIITAFKEVAGEEADVEMQGLKTEYLPAMMFLSEEDRRVQEMQALYGMAFQATEKSPKIVLNKANKMVQKLNSDINAQDKNLICQHILDLAELNYKGLESNRMEQFIQRNMEILNRII